MPNRMQIIVLEGPLSQTVTDVLTEAGWSVMQAADAAELLSEVEDAALVVVDVLASGMDLEACRQLEQQVEAPVLVIVPALDAGYELVALRAPFEPDALVQQVQELLAEPRAEVVQVGELVIDQRGRRVTLRGRWIVLSKTEFDLPVHLVRRIGEVVPYDDLLEAVWGYPAGQGDRKLVTNWVGRVRRKLDEEADRHMGSISPPPENKSSG